MAARPAMKAPIRALEMLPEKISDIMAAMVSSSRSRPAMISFK